jgi:hypothetical protein
LLFFDRFFKKENRGVKGQAFLVFFAGEVVLSFFSLEVLEFLVEFIRMDKLSFFNVNGFPEFILNLKEFETLLLKDL